MSEDRSGLRAELYAMLDAAAPEIASKASGWERVATLAGRSDITLTFSASEDKVSVYIKARTEAAANALRDAEADLTKHLGTVVGRGTGAVEQGFWFRQDNPNACLALRRTWPEAVRWWAAKYIRYYAAIKQLEDRT